jgi:bifunctional DNA-binding transcriptional regulator/antitoxin component of YhaV-PrlF toxin-antitoxin module
MLRKPNVQGQITIPKKILKKINFNSDSDYFDISIYGSIIILSPVTTKPKYSKEDLKKIEELFTSDKNKGLIFYSKTDALKHLRTKIKKK